MERYQILQAQYENLQVQILEYLYQGEIQKYQIIQEHWSLQKKMFVYEKKNHLFGFQKLDSEEYLMHFSQKSQKRLSHQ